MRGTSKFLALLTTTRLHGTLLHRPCRFLHRRSFVSHSTLSNSSLRRTVSSPAQLSSLQTPITTSWRQFQSEALPVHNSNSAHGSSPSTAHPWPEWFNFINSISARGVVDGNRVIPVEDAFVAYEQLPDDFVRAAKQCLAFARQRPNLLGSLSKRDMEVVVSNGTPFLFRTALETARRMRAFLGIDENCELGLGNAHTIDIMKYILSYASNPAGSSGQSPVYSRKLLDISIRNLLQELVKVGWETPASVLPPQGVHQFSGRAGESPRFAGQNIVMKRGDWICPKCHFMNFARNLKCLECEEPRPRSQLTGRSWECPKSDFLNNGRNDASGSSDKGDGKQNPRISVWTGKSLERCGVKEEEANGQLDMSEEAKTERWFQRVSQIKDISELSQIPDEDFPSIMPMRKGFNRFVVSKRKTPLERRLTSSHYKRNLPAVSSDDLMRKENVGNETDWE